MHASSESCSFVQASLKVFLSMKIIVTLANSVDADEMSQNVTFHLCLSLPTYLFQVSSIKKGISKHQVTVLLSLNMPYIHLYNPIYPKCNETLPTASILKAEQVYFPLKKVCKM